MVTGNPPRSFTSAVQPCASAIAGARRFSSRATIARRSSDSVRIVPEPRGALSGMMLFVVPAAIFAIVTHSRAEHPDAPRDHRLQRADHRTGGRGHRVDAVLRHARRARPAPDGDREHVERGEHQSRAPRENTVRRSRRDVEREPGVGRRIGAPLVDA